MSIILNNKGQLKIKQMIFMLLAVTLFLILAGLFFISIKVVGLQKEVIELKRDKAAGLVEKISGNPEFVFDGKANAIDSDKLMILKTQTEYLSIVNGKRKTFWGVDGIIVRKIYPLEEDIECTNENYPDCNLIKIFTNSNSAPISSFVSLCSKKNVNGINQDYCELAEVMIEEESLNEK